MAKQKGWLDKYSEEINANEGYSSAPKEWMGEGYSNVGRDFSPAWGGQFKEGGYIPQAQFGKIIPEPTEGDSLVLYNNTLALLDYYGNKKKYKNTGSDIIPNKTSRDITKSNMDDVNRVKERLKNSFPFTTNRSSLYSREGLGDKDFKLSEYYGRFNPYQYRKRESANTILDLDAPFARYDTRINPTINYNFENIDRGNGWKSNILFGDQVSFYGYDPLAVKPYILRTPKEKIEWNNKYGKKTSQPIPPPALKKKEETPQKPKPKTPQNPTIKVGNKTGRMSGDIFVFDKPIPKPEPTLKPRPFVPATKLPMGEPSEGMQIQQRTFPKLNIPNVNMSGPYMVGYTDYDTQQGVDRGFATAEERDAFVQTLRERDSKANVNLNSNISSYYDLSKRKKEKKKYGGNILQAQEGLSFLPEQDPEMMYTDRFNTSLTKKEQKEFNEWVAKESERQGRDIMMDKGAYDVQGFWKSGDYKKMDQDNHGTDTWKKPNHPTFSNQSNYHGVDGFYGGNWTNDAGYQPSKQTASTYGPSYYSRLFAEEPNRPEHLDASRYTSGVNRPSPLYYAMGGSLPGSTGFMYARTGAPSNGPYAKKTRPSAQTGVNITETPQVQSMEEGESAAKDWLQNWYTGRAKDPKFTDLANKRLDALQKLKVEGDPDLLRTREAYGIYGFYPNNYTPIVDVSSDPTGIQTSNILHEELHGLSNLAPQEDIPNILAQNDLLDPYENYDLVNEDEKLARLYQFRKRYGIDPNKEYTTEDMQEIMDDFNSRPTPKEKGKELDPNFDWNIKQLFEIIGNDPEKLRNLNRDVVKNNSNQSTVAKYGMTYYQNGLDWKPKSISKNGKRLDKYGPGGSIMDGCPPYFTKNAFGVCVNASGQTPEQANAFKNTINTVLNPQKKSVGTPYKTRSQEVKEATDRAHRQNFHIGEFSNQATINQGQATTKESEARRKTLTQQAVSNMPNVVYDEQTGTTSAVNPNMTYTGEPANFMGERQQKSVDHIMGSLEAAGYITGASELVGAGYNLLKPIIAESVETGLLSKVGNFIKPSAPTYLGEAVSESKLLSRYNPITKADEFYTANVADRLVPGRSFEDVSHKMSNLRKDLGISRAEDFLYKRVPKLGPKIPLDQGKGILFDAETGQLFDSNTRYWLNRQYGHTPSINELLEPRGLVSKFKSIGQSPKQSSLFGNSEMFTNPKQYFTKPSGGPTYNPNYESIKNAISQGRDPLAETLSFGTYTPAPRVLDWKKIGQTAAGVGIGSGLISGALNQKKEGGVVKDDNGYWNPDNWGKVVEIDSPDITMQGVNQPLLGISDEGDVKYMTPGKNYKFKGKKVKEYPVGKNGINQQDEKVIEQLDQLTNFTNYNKPTKGGWLDKYN